MKRIIVSLALVALAAPAVAQEDFATGEVVLGLSQTDVPSSSIFFQYRDIPQGGVLPFFQFQGRKGDYNYNFYGYGVTQKDQRYFGTFESTSWKFDASFVGVPHKFGNAGLSPLNPTDATGQTEWRMSDTLQAGIQSQVEALPSRNYNTVLPIVTPVLEAQPANIDVRLQRNQTRLAFSLFPGGGSFDLGVTYFHERRAGTRTNNGTAFGFNNVIELPEPVNYITQDFGLNGSLKGGWGSAFAALNFNIFDERLDTFGWDNPFRGTDSTDGRAYLGPYTTVNGPKTGLMALPPSNKAWNFKLGTTLNFGRSTRLSADGQVGQWTQNEQQLIGWTTNTAVLTPSGIPAVDAPLPINQLDGKIDTTALNAYFTTRLGSNLRFNARYRYYDNDNKTPRTEFPGYVRFDAVWEDIGRITVPFGFTNSYLDTYLTYDIGTAADIEVGWKYEKRDRTFRETEETTENTFRVAGDVRTGGGFALRAIFETGNRDFDHYDGIHAEEQSFLPPHGDPANQTVLRRYDQANRDRDRFGGQLQWSPGSGVVTLAASYFHNKEEYDQSPVSCEGVTDSDEFCVGDMSNPLGLVETSYETFSLDLDYTPNERTTLYGFFSREDIMDVQTGRQSGGSLRFDPSWNWRSTVDTKVDTIGAGANLDLVPDTLFFKLFYRYQKIDGNNAFEGGSSLRDPQDIADYDDTEINHLGASLKWQFTEAWAAGIGGFWEKYTIRDSQTGEILNYMPGSFFLKLDDFDYNSWAALASLTYSFGR
jgi:MtrB/PioB family decaheme-associated outer membrane protein